MKIHKFRNGIQSFILNLKNFRDWFSIIFNDRHYDDHYLYIILRHKLKLMLRANKGYNNDIYYDRLRLCIDLLDKIIDDVYYDEMLKYIDIETTFNGSFSIATNRDRLDDYFLKYKNIHKRLVLKCNRTTTAFLIADARKSKAIKLVFKIMGQYSQYWWN